MNTEGAPETRPSAIVIDQVELFRLGVESVLSNMDFLVIGSSALAGDGLRRARGRVHPAELVIVGGTRSKASGGAQSDEIAATFTGKSCFSWTGPAPGRLRGSFPSGLDALLLRTASRFDLTDALKGVERGERVVAAGPCSRNDRPGRAGRVRQFGWAFASRARRSRRAGRRCHLRPDRENHSSSPRRPSRPTSFTSTTSSK